MQTILEILKITIPALVVFATAYFLLTAFFRNEYSVRVMAMRQSQQDVTVPVKFGALERFALLCERIHLPNVAMRVSNGLPDLEAQTMYYGILLSIQQEFEHNIAQQIYVSPDLWEMVRTAKNDTVTTATYLYQSLPEGATGHDFFRTIADFYPPDKRNQLDMVQLAIKKEAALILPA
jgi:hypothetical protein